MGRAESEFYSFVSRKVLSAKEGKEVIVDVTKYFVGVLLAGSGARHSVLEVAQDWVKMNLDYVCIGFHNLDLNQQIPRSVAVTLRAPAVRQYPVLAQIVVLL